MGGGAAVATALRSSLAGSAKGEMVLGLRSWTGGGAAVATALGSSIAGLAAGEFVPAVSKVEAGEPTPACRPE
jgi:hypothetical protein